MSCGIFARAHIGPEDTPDPMREALCYLKGGRLTWPPGWPMRTPRSRNSGEIRAECRQMPYVRPYPAG